MTNATMTKLIVQLISANGKVDGRQDCMQLGALTSDCTPYALGVNNVGTGARARLEMLIFSQLSFE